MGEPCSHALKLTKEVQAEKLRTFNELAAAFKRCLQSSYKIKGYITLQEQYGNWSEDSKHLPINVHAEDFLTLVPDKEGN